MKRRTLLAAASAALLAAPASALCILDPGDTHIARLFRQWEAAKSAYSGAEEDAEFDGWSEMAGIEDAILATAPQTIQDYAIKIIVLNDFSEIGGSPWGDAMMAEARSLAA